MDVGGWLRSLGLEQYEAAFRENGIDEQALRHVTTEDLRQIGVSTVGDRRKLLTAIEELAAPSVSMYPRGAPSLAMPPKIPEVFGERRPITVMFCDLVGSTGLAASLDVEDWRNLLSAYLDRASAAVSQMGGRVAKTLGDGLMALFGHPIAEENDSERAVRAALAIQHALAELNRKNAGSGQPALVARIGIESGAVVVDAAGEVFGDAPNVAARVQALAEPGAVMVTARVQRQVSGLFIAEDRGAHLLEGSPEPLTLFRIVRASGGRRAGARFLTSLVGRKKELSLLRQQWEQAREGAGQITFIVGEAGIGKSRLLQEFRATLGQTLHTWSEFPSSQLLQNTPLHSFAEWGRQRFGADEPAEQRLADLENTLRLIGLDPAEYTPLIAPLVDIPLTEERAARFAPEELRQRQLAALVAWLLAGARVQPIVLVFEDLHWADPTSVDLLRTFAEEGARARLFLLATARPEFRPAWSPRSRHSIISLSPLDRADIAQMIGELAPRHALSQEVIEGVSERTGGVPLFVEEVTRLLLERGEAGALQAIPPTLQHSFAARLDRLGEARTVAQIGAVLGRDFTYALLSAMSHMDNLALRRALARLTDADVLICEGAGSHRNYRFKHTLIQEAAYESLLKSSRQALHRRAAEILVEQPDPAAVESEVIARHFTEAGLDERAVEWWAKAGDQAFRRSAFQEAIAHLGKAIELADRAGDPGSPFLAVDGAASSQRLKLQLAYGQAMMWAKGFAAEETRAAFSRAAELAAKAGKSAERFAAYHGQWASAIVRGEVRSALEIASTFLKEAENAGRVTEVGVAHRCLAFTCYDAGSFAEARAHCERALEVCNPERDRETRERFGEDPETMAMSCLALTTWQLGEVQRAREWIGLANRRANELRHAPSMALPLCWKSFLEIMRGDATAALSAAKALERLSREHGMTFWRIRAELHAGWARGRLHDAAAGAEEMRRSQAALADQGATANAWFYKVLLAELERETLGADSALARIDEAVALARQVDNRCDFAFPYWLRGKILIERDPSSPAPAEEAFQTAIAIAREQGAASWGLRAALPLAKLYQSTARHAEAHGILAPALEGFAPTPEMPEIAEAKALLQRLA